MRTIVRAVCAILFMFATSYVLAAEKGSDQKLAKASQNPIASLISVPIQYDVSD